MFFLLSKVLTFLLKPVVWGLLALLIALLSRDPARRKWFLLAAFSIFILFSNASLVNLAYRAWEPDPMPLESLAPAEIGILLSGGSANSDPRPNSDDFFYSSWAANRIHQALELWYKGKVKHLLLSGGCGRVSGNCVSESVRTREYFLELGMPDSLILLEPDSRNTRENAVMSAAVLRSTDLAEGRILLITSAFHMRRARLCFEKAGLQVVPFPVDYIGNRQPFSITPSAKALFLWEVLIKEWVGLLVYRVMGYV